MMNWLRNSPIAAGLLTMLRLYVGSYPAISRSMLPVLLRGRLRKRVEKSPSFNNGLGISWKALPCRR